MNPVVPLIPRLLIAATHSGAGKTSITAGLIAALRARGLKVAPFKVGPDFIDTGYHALAAGQPSRNLDSWMLDDAALLELFDRGSRGCDVAVIEGVMGLYDGETSRGGRGSTAYVARLLRAPVILIVDAWAQAESVAAHALGFARLDPTVKVVGVIANRVAGKGHAAMIATAMRRIPEVAMIGSIPRKEGAKLPERHLGLLPVPEQRGARDAIQKFSGLAQQYLDLNNLMRIARSAPRLMLRSRPIVVPTKLAVPVAVAWDEAFNFYYEDNLDLLTSLGADLIRFSPLRDWRIPPRAKAVYLGGGFPEIFARDLSRNAPMREDMLHRINAACPTYAECGGFMYLAQRLMDAQGKGFAMVGAIPGETLITPRLQHFGYTEATVVRRTLLGRTGERIRGHEFHCSRWTRPANRPAYRILSGAASGRLEGYSRGNLLASYLHLHLLSRPQWARRFVEAARQWPSGTIAA